MGQGGVGIAFSELAGARRISSRGDAPAVALEVEDATITELRSHPLVTGEPRIRFLCVVPLVTADGHALGALVVADRVPRRLEPAQRTALDNLATLAMARLEARRSPAPGVDAHEARERAEEAQEQLAREREFADAVIQSLPGAFFLFSREGEMLRWNVRLQAATGYTGLEIAAMRPLDLIVPADRAAVEAAIREVLDHGRESRSRHRCGTRRARAGPTRSPAGRCAWRGRRT